jgi:hypothetical protein
MPGTNQPHDQYLLNTIRDLQSSLFALSTSPLLNDGAIQKGCLQVLDGAGVARVQIGLIPDGLGFYGMRTLALDGVTELFRTDDRGLIQPAQVLETRAAVTMEPGLLRVATTNASMGPTFQANWIGGVLAAGMLVLVPWLTDAGTTGAIQVVVDTSGNTPTATQSLPAGSSGTHVANWVHGVPLSNSSGSTGPTFTVNARCTGGTGSVHIYMPTFLWIGPNANAQMATNGGWT